MLYSSVYNLFALLGRKAPFTHSLTTLVHRDMSTYMYTYTVHRERFTNALVISKNQKT